MFRFHKTLDIISLFHKPAAPSSLRVVTLLKQISAQASETATEDQASDHTHQNKLQRTTFELNVTEEVPTSDQLRTILEYVGEDKASEIVEGAKDSGDAIRRLKQNPKLFKAPVTVDWNNGRAVLGDKKSEIMKMIAQQAK
ncbi:MAG: hypothetical protein HETSPECPRED_000924 [Heterodermia speciosa]|uniref:Uncharacterized protein n=1 Tax=Heterodermia speciosa TaxID=116794 RepID=A0A8H3ETJ8_9LECA|nr:MAG: hypothetical protein HETSPECPRED_000924 [Heterodermia speciosa]